MKWIILMIGIYGLLHAWGLFRARASSESDQYDLELEKLIERQKKLNQIAKDLALKRAEAKQCAEGLEHRAAIQQEAKEVVAQILKKYDVSGAALNSEAMRTSSAPPVSAVMTAAGDQPVHSPPSQLRDIASPSLERTRPVEPSRPADRFIRRRTNQGKIAAMSATSRSRLAMLLFDLDDTLLATSSLAPFRGRDHLGEQPASYVEALQRAAGGIAVLIPQPNLLALAQRQPGLQLGVVTRAPRVYAQTLLTQHFPSVGWDVIIALEDTPGNVQKSDPDGLLLAAQHVGIDDMARVAMICNDELALAATYQAGALAVLSTIAWGQQWAKQSGEKRSQHYAALGLVPDAVLHRADELMQFVDAPDSFLPALENWQLAHRGLDRSIPMRVESRRHFLPVEGVSPNPHIEIYYLARYFTAAHTGRRYNFSRRSALHPINMPLLDAKRGFPYPDAWADCCARYILAYVECLPRASLPLLVCTIPSSSQGRGAPGAERMIGLLGQIWDRVHPRAEIVLQGEVFEYSAGVMQNKHLRLFERLQNVRDHLKVVDPLHVSGRAVLVLDDVATTGATMYHAAQSLHAAGAASVRCLVLAHAVS